MWRDPSDVVSEMYPAFERELVEYAIDLMQVSRRICQGDMEQSLAFYVIAARTLQHRDFRHMRMGSGAEHRRHPPSLGTNARSVAESLGMPRESVRRRVEGLVRAGYVIRCGKELALSAEGLRALEPLRHLLVQLSVRNFQIVSALVGPD